MDLDQVLPKLYVGSYPRYDDVATLNRYGITTVLNVQSDEDLQYLGLDWPEMREQYFALDKEVRRVPIFGFNDDLRDKLPEAVRVLSELVNVKHGVFVYCNAGANRSPSVVIAWLSWELGWNLDVVSLPLCSRFSERRTPLNSIPGRGGNRGGCSCGRRYASRRCSFSMSTMSSREFDALDRKRQTSMLAMTNNECLLRPSASPFACLNLAHAGQLKLA